MRNENTEKRGNRAPRGRSNKPGYQSFDRPSYATGNEQGGTQKKRFIKRDQKGKGGKGGRDNKGGKKDDRDLDRELRDYWIGEKGSKADVGIFVLT